MFKLMPMRVLNLGRRDYAETLQAMRGFTAQRTAATADELWLVEHAPVYTQGVAGRAEHVLDARDIPVVQSNRGGQVTYHGPGQVVAYPLIDLRRLHIHVKEYVYRRLDDPFGHAALAGPAPAGEPFRGLGKIAALGIKVSRHCAYHGVALNVAMDLSPFERIDPCGYAGLRTVDLATLGVPTDWATVAPMLAQRLSAQLTP